MYGCVQILGQAKNPAIIQAHLKKLFAGVHGVALTDSKDAITAAMSIESEHVQLASAVPVSEQVESWLQTLLSCMQTTLQVSMQKPTAWLNNVLCLHIKGKYVHANLVAVLLCVISCEVAAHYSH